MNKKKLAKYLLALGCLAAGSGMLVACGGEGLPTGPISSGSSSSSEHTHTFTYYESDGNATCTQDGTKTAECDGIGCNETHTVVDEGSMLAHMGEEVWVKRLNTHHRIYTCCYSQSTELEAHTLRNGVCTTCGFNPSITVSSAEVDASTSQVALSISVTDNPGITGLMLSLQYNADVFTMTEAESGEALDVLTFTEPSKLGSGCTFLWDGIEVKDEDVKDGVLLTLTFDISPDALAGEYSFLLKVNAYDNELNPFTLVITGGKVTIENS